MTVTPRELLPHAFDAHNLKEFGWGRG
jgi:hypothetical protein